MKNHWLNEARIRDEEKKIRIKYCATNFAKKHYTLAEKVVQSGLGCLTTKERKVAFGPRRFTLMDEIILQEDLRVILTLLDFSRSESV